jgi:hypothetical protein
MVRDEPRGFTLVVALKTAIKERKKIFTTELTEKHGEGKKSPIIAAP